MHTPLVARADWLGSWQQALCTATITVPGAGLPGGALGLVALGAVVWLVVAVRKGHLPSGVKSWQSA